MDNNRINIDDIDLKILHNLHKLKKNEQITTYELAKRILDMSDKKVAKNSFITTRLERLGRYGVIDVKKVGDNPKTTNYYDLIAEKVMIKRITNSKINIDCKAMFVNINGRWNIFVRDFL